MLELSYEKLIPFPFEVVLSQYFDYEHIAHVHPKTLGEYRVIERDGDRIVYDQIWPPGLFGRRQRSRVAQIFFPPNRTAFEFISGRYRGTRVDSILESRPDGTLVRETYHVPGMPNWGWLKPLIRPLMMRTIDRVWDEDLRVEVCYGGWPGIPGKEEQPSAPHGASLARLRHDLGPVEEFPQGCARRLNIDGAEVAIFGAGGGWRAVGNRCPHTGGPLALGRVEGETVACPWHGAMFDLKCGRAISGPTAEPIAVYKAEAVGGRLMLDADPIAPTR